MLLFLFLGVVAGAVTGIPIGPVNVAVIDAAYRHTLRRAICVGLGGAVGDFIYSGLGVVGVKPLLEHHTWLPKLLYALSGAVLLVYGFMTARSQPVQPAMAALEDAMTESHQQLVLRRELWQGFTVGIALILLNPAAVITWVLIVGQQLPEMHSLWEGVAFAVGVFSGSLGWFSAVAYFTHKGKNVLGEKAAWIPRVIGIALMGYGVYLIAKAVKGAVA